MLDFGTYTSPFGHSTVHNFPLPKKFAAGPTSGGKEPLGNVTGHARSASASDVGEGVVDGDETPGADGRERCAGEDDPLEVQAVRTTTKPVITSMRFTSGSLASVKPGFHVGYTWDARMVPAFAGPIAPRAGGHRDAMLR